METRFDASNYELEETINMNNELDGKIMTWFARRSEQKHIAI